MLLASMSMLVVTACSGEAESRASAVPVAAATTTTPVTVETAPTVVGATTPQPETAPPTSAATVTTVAPTTAAATTAPAPPPPTAAPTTAAPPPATTAPCRVVTLNDTIRRGDCGDAVTFIQERLTVLGFPAAPDGLFGPGTEAAVKDFQASRGLVADGIVGPLTWAKLVEGGIGD